MHRFAFIVALLLSVSCAPQPAVVTTTPPAPPAASTATPSATDTATAFPTATLAPTATWTPTTAPTASVAPSPVPPTVTPLPPTATVDARATEQKIASNIFATLTAAAPTSTPIPKATEEPWRLLCRQAPDDQGAIVVTNYIGEKDILVIIGKTKSIATKGSDTLIVVPPGKFDANFVAEGWGKGWNWVVKFDIGPGWCQHYQVWYTRQ